MYNIHYTLCYVEYTEHCIQYSVYRICSVYCTGVNLAEIFLIQLQS